MAPSDGAQSSNTYIECQVFYSYAIGLINTKRTLGSSAEDGIGVPQVRFEVLLYDPDDAALVVFGVYVMIEDGFDVFYNFGVVLLVFCVTVGLRSVGLHSMGLQDVFGDNIVGELAGVVVGKTAEERCELFLAHNLRAGSGGSADEGRHIASGGRCLMRCGEGSVGWGM